MSEFNPDWDVKEAALDSLREHMAIARDLKAKNQQLQSTNKQLLEALEKIVAGHNSEENAGGGFLSWDELTQAGQAITNAKQMGDK